jgi:hypothetical protein
MLELFMYIMHRNLHLHMGHCVKSTMHVTQTLFCFLATFCIWADLWDGPDLQPLMSYSKSRQLIVDQLYHYVACMDVNPEYFIHLPFWFCIQCNHPIKFFFAI